MKSKLLNSLLGVAIGIMPFVMQAQTTTYNVSPEMVPSQIYTNDGIVSNIVAQPANNPYLNGNNVGGVNSLKVGKSSSSGAANTTSAIIPFKLPVRPAGKLVVTAKLKVHVNYGREWANTNVDLYGLKYNAASTIYPADHYDGTTYPDATAGVTGIQDNYFMKNVAAGALDTPRFEETNSTANAALVAYLNAQYDAGAVAGDYVFLRLSVDNPAMTGAHYFGVSDGSTANKPTLTLEIQDAGVSTATADYTITTPAEDGYVSNPAIITANNPFLSGAAKLGSSAVDGSANLTSVILPFQLPARPVGQNVDFANLNVYVSYGRQYVNSNVDLYGLPYKKATTNGGTGSQIFSANHFAGVYPDATSGVMAIEDDYFAKNVAQGSLDTPRWEETTASTSLIAYLNAQYNAGAVAGDWVFLRLSMDNAAMTGAQYFNIDGGDSANPAALKIGFTGAPLSTTSFEKATLNLYPNPIKGGKLNVSLVGFNNEVRLHIYSLTGQLLHSEKVDVNSQSNFSTSLSLKPGLYIAKLEDGKTQKTQKLIVE